MSIDNLPPGVTLSAIPGVMDTDPREDDRSDDLFMLELTGEQIGYVLKALRFYRCEAPGKRVTAYLTIQDRKAIRGIEGELERVVE
jgi:hypothetical protein